MAGVLALRKATLKYILVSMNEFRSIMPDSIIIIIIIIIIKIHYAGSFLPLSLYATILPGAYSTSTDQKKLGNNWWTATYLYKQ